MSMPKQARLRGAQSRDGLFWESSLAPRCGARTAGSLSPARCCCSGRMGSQEPVDGGTEERRKVSACGGAAQAAGIRGETARICAGRSALEGVS